MRMGRNHGGNKNNSSGQGKGHNGADGADLVGNRAESSEAGRQVQKEIEGKMRQGQREGTGWKSINGSSYGGAQTPSGSFSFREFIRDKSVRAGLIACGAGILIAFLGSVCISGQTLRMIAMTLGGCISLTGVSQITRYISEH